jgi:PAS domain S-box-containing protein
MKVHDMLWKIVDGSPIPSFVISSEHKVILWNVALEALSGIRRKEVIGTRKQWRAFYPEKRPTLADLIADGAPTEEIEKYYRGRHRKSRVIADAHEASDYFKTIGERGKWLLFTASPVKDEQGTVLAVIETLQDITEARELRQSMHYYVQLTTRVQEEERKRIARDLHDDVSSSLLTCAQRLDALASAQRLSPQLRGSLEELREKTVEALERVRSYAQDLRPRILDDLGLIAALEWMAEEMENKYHIKTQVTLTGETRDLHSETQLLLFRIAQEALTNVRRHACATAARITLDCRDDQATLTIKDNGRGFQLPNRIEDLTGSGCLGIMGMSERAQLLGGTLELTSSPGQGTQVTAKLPLSE